MDLQKIENFCKYVIINISQIMFLEGGNKMYNGKFEKKKSDKKQDFVRYLPLVYIVLISASIVLLGYLLCMFSINAVKAMYEFWVENSDKFAFSNEVFVVLAVVFLLVGFVILLRKSYLSEWANYTPAYVEEEKVENNAKVPNNTQKTKEPKMVQKAEKPASKQPTTKRKRQVQRNEAEYDVSLNEVVWTNEEPSNRYGFKF